LDMGVTRRGLVRASPSGPSDDVGGLDAALGEPDSDATKLLDRPADQSRRRGVRILFGGGAWFAR